MTSICPPPAQDGVPLVSELGAAAQEPSGHGANAPAGRLGEPHPYIQTAKGRAFPLLDPRPEAVHLDDVAFALAHLNRYTGHGGPYSVAQHSVHVSQLVESWGGDTVEVFAGLIHDGPEAYVGDVASPLKRLLPAFRSIEAGVWHAMAERWCVLPVLPDIVKAADLSMLMAEARDLLGPPVLSHGWPDVEPAPIAVVPWSAGEAHDRFLARFAELASELEVTP